MEALNFRPEPFEFEGAPSTGCGCTQCRQQEFEQGDNEYEWETDKRAKCSADTPSEVEECGSEKAKKPIQCHPDFTKECPALPETWKSTTIAGVKFFYKPTVKNRGGGRYEVTADGTNKQVNLAPTAWRAAQMWVASMNGVFAMRISAVYTAGAGRYCRCVRTPDTCKESDKANWHLCRGKTISDHGFGDALDIVGVRWVDPKGVGSSLPTTVIHSWQDANQAALLIRMNAAMRLVFHTVLDYSRKDHRDHFHCDMNQGHGGGARTLFGESPCEQNFIMSSLKRLNYLSTTKPVAWARAKTALADFAQVNNMTAPTGSDRNAWRPIVHRLYACVALGIPGTCAKP